MNCKELNGISSNICELSIGGIKQVFVFPFEEIGQYTYDNDNLNLVTGYSVTVLPNIVYIPIQSSSEYTGAKSIRSFKSYTHRLSMKFNTMTGEKRQEFKSMEDMDLTLIFADRNGRCWIMGQDVPCRLDSINVGSGVKGGDNGYDIVVQSTEKQHLREIVCPSGMCFTSFLGTESRLTTFDVTDSSTFYWEYIETDINGTIVSLDLQNTPLQPLLWNTDPIVLANDRSFLTVLFSSLGATVTFLGTTHNTLTDTTTISIESSTSAYGTFQVDNTVFNKTSYLSTLNLSTILAVGIANPSSIIVVRDSNNDVVFSEGYGNSVNHLPNISGTSNNAQLNMSALYPNGTTLTAEILNVPCSEVTYTYNYINTLEACDLEVDYSFVKGVLSEIEVPYLTSTVDYTITQKFQNTSLNVFGTHFQLYKRYTTWHDDFNQFVSDVTLMFFQVVLPIDVNSLVFTDTGASVKIGFKVLSSIEEYHFRQQVVVFDGAFAMTEWKQARNTNLTTIAPIGSTVSHEDSHLNIIEGDYLSNITQNTFELGYDNIGNTSIEDVTLVYNWDSVPYTSTDSIATKSIGGDCNTRVVVTNFESCYDDFNILLKKSLINISLDCGSPSSINLGSSFTIEHETLGVTVTTAFTTPITVTPNEGVNYFTDRLNSIGGVRVLHYDFDVITRTYNFWCSVDNDTEVLDVKDVGLGRVFDISLGQSIYINRLTTNMNPFVKLSWVLPTFDLSSDTPLEDLTHGHWQLTKTIYKTLNVIWDGGSDKLFFAKISGFDNAITVGFYESYPQATNAVLFEYLGSGVSNGGVSNVSSKLISNGSSIGAINFVSYTNNLGWRQVKAIDLTVAKNKVVFSEVVQKPICYGTPDSINYVGTEGIAQPTVDMAGVVCL